MTDLHELVPDFSILVNGSELSTDILVDVVGVSVHQDVNAASMFTIRMMTWDIQKSELTWVDDSLFNVGNTVSIKMGYVDHVQEVIAGEITGLELEYIAAEPPQLVVRGYDRRHRLLRGRKTKSFLNMKDSDIAKQIAGNHSLSPTVVDTKVKLDYVLQHNQTDMEFLLDRAQRIGYEVVVEDKKLYFRPRQVAGSEALTLDLQQDLLEFFPRLTAVTQVGEMSVRGWDIKKKEAITGKATSESTKLGSKTGTKAAGTFGTRAEWSVERPVSTKAEADAIAQGRFDEMALAYVTAEGKILGNTSLKAGEIVKIEGAGKRFSGKYYVTSAVHTYMPRTGYETNFTLRRNATDG
ncbi:MAG: phage late control D family protein [Chloroflexi bacterium]|nr:MAG: hypothetical protein CUN54_03720 [Phototrophicales bacterium]RMF82202.1 MAG: phage late control D family protein [Chloroflexota bacterium]